MRSLVTGAGRGPGETIAIAVVFPASSHAAYITGEVLKMHGGVDFV